MNTKTIPMFQQPGCGAQHRNGIVISKSNNYMVIKYILII